MTHAEAATRIQELTQQLNYHNQLYYQESRVEITDYDFDQLLEELIRLEQSFPDLLRSDSPSQRVGGTITKEFQTVAHEYRMLSLGNTYTLEELIAFIEGAQLDAVGVFAYSDEDGTAAVDLPDHLPEHEVQARFEAVSKVALRVSESSALRRIGQSVTVLIEEPGNLGRAEHQGPEVDGSTTIVSEQEFKVGDFISAVVSATDGVDLLAKPVSA